MQTLICYILNDIRFAALYVNPKVSTKDKLEEITDVASKKGSKIVLAGDFLSKVLIRKKENYIERIGE